MKVGMFLENSHYREYVRLLKELHALDMNGQGESDEAEALRDAMDGPWCKLSPEEMALAGILSADLYMLTGEEVFRNVPPEQRTQEWLAPRVQVAQERQDWGEVLELLRNGPDFLSADQLAFVRGQMYENLGHLDIALMFYEFADRTNSEVARYSAHVMQTLRELGQTEDAVLYARQVMNRENAPPVELLTAASVLLSSTKDTPYYETEQTCHVILSLIEQIENTQSIFQDADQIAVETAVLSLTLQGMCYERLGQIDDAIQAFARIVALDPKNEAAWVWRGMLLYGTDPEAATADFERAVELNTVSISPYTFLAHHALVHQEYERALQLCQRALFHAKRPSTIARLLGWSAIASHRLDKPERDVERLFKVALEYDPFNEDIRRNYNLFKDYLEATTHQSSPQYKYSLPPVEQAKNEITQQLSNTFVAA